MRLNQIDRLGNWNPQLLRELKGRLKPRNLVVAGAISLLGQFLLLIVCQGQVPMPTLPSIPNGQIRSRYCTGNADTYAAPECILDGLGSFQINWQLWRLDLFIILSFIGIFVLIVAGTYMLISDVTTEQRRDTLNFIRLSPESTRGILVGKMLGVPILLYFVVFLAVPLHLWAGLSAQIPLGQILGFWLVTTASCLLFYSAGLLYGLTSQWLGGFQIWLGSGIVLAFLILNFNLIREQINSPFAWSSLLTPFNLIPNLDISSFKLTSFKPTRLQLEKLEWFYLPIGASTISLFGVALLNCGLWTYWIGQGLKRCFRNPQATILSKRQSYLVTACFEMVILGCATPGFAFDTSWSSSSLFSNLVCLSGWNFLLALFLIAALSPHRQVLQDWARYRKQGVSKSKGFWNRNLVHDLIWSEKSPAIVAIVINLAIATIPLVVWTLLLPIEADEHIKALFSLVSWLGLMTIYAAIFQLMLLMKTQNQMFWASGTLGAAIFLPPIVLGLLFIAPDKNLLPWLFSAFAPFAPLAYAGTSTLGTVLLAILGQWSIVVLLSLRLTRQLRQAGESTSKVLFAGN